MLSGIATIVLVVGVLLVGVGIYQRIKAGRVSKAAHVPTGDAATRGASVAGKGGAISVEGPVVCPEPLLSPVTQTPCLYYEVDVTGFWKEGNNNRSKKYYDDKLGVTFAVDDGTGPVKVLASGGGAFELKRTFRETRREGALDDIRNLVGNTKPIYFQSFAFPNPPMSKANKFECVERVLPVLPKAYVCGKSEGDSIGGATFARLMVSGRSRDEVLGRALKASKYTLFGGAGAAAVGVVLGVIAVVMAPAVEAAPPSFAAPPVASADLGYDEAPAAEPLAPAAEAADPCAQVRSCCEAIGSSFGGGAQRSCESAAAGATPGCVDYLTMNAQIHGTAGHPLQGRLPPACLPSE
jgi:hypothetical protein